MRKLEVGEQRRGVHEVRNSEEKEWRAEANKVHQKIDQLCDRLFHHSKQNQHKNNQIQHQHQQNIHKLEKEIGKLVITNPRREVGQLPSQPTSNPRNQSIFAVQQALTSQHFENVKAVTTLRNRKVIKDRFEGSVDTYPILNPKDDYDSLFLDGEGQLRHKKKSFMIKEGVVLGHILDDALWAYRTAYKTPLGASPFKLIYCKVCHLLVKMEHRVY
ncbi:unnamed protein product [Spirodela intermedia]|uniref:Uncharacterized protein n=1 Tax=Spirodela intermedia TaxID=51605 RepID=A0A7I8IIL6_SPIIN|nr:unnamed protein product [Spirodela intermedia]CAA6657189.1 unnamed protein product [Spirodela intermedia]CAA6674120.1 unnamed protein product [Spirodela intermedia]